jgi:hypothetical protein
MLCKEDLRRLSFVKSDPHRLDISHMVINDEPVESPGAQSVVVRVEEHESSPDRGVTGVMHSQEGIGV